MSLYHLSCRIVGRSEGKDATAGIAYITRSKVYDRTTGLEFDHTHHKDKILFAGRYLPESHPEFAELKKDKRGKPDFGELWNLVQEKENRKNSQFCRSFDIALQSEFTLEENLECLDEWIKINWTGRGLAADAAIHGPHTDEEGECNNNTHGHVMVTTRKMDGTGWTTKDREANDRQYMKTVIRGSWSDIVNRVFERKMIAAHQEEYDKILDAEQSNGADPDAAKRESIEKLYDLHPEEDKRITEKSNKELAEDLEEQISLATEANNYLRVDRLQKRLQKALKEPQRHVGPVATAMQRKGKKTNRQKYTEEQQQFNDDLEKSFQETTFTEQQMENALKYDPEYKQLLDRKQKLLKELDLLIKDEEELAAFRVRVFAIESIEEFQLFEQNEWKPEVERIQLYAENQSIITDWMDKGKSFIKERFTKIQSLSYLCSMDLFDDAEYKGDYYQDRWINEIKNPVMKHKEKHSGLMEIWDFIKEKAAWIIEHSPLKIFSIFRKKKAVVDEKRDDLMRPVKEKADMICQKLFADVNGMEYKDKKQSLESVKSLYHKQLLFEYFKDNGSKELEYCRQLARTCSGQYEREVDFFCSRVKGILNYSKFDPGNKEFMERLTAYEKDIYKDYGPFAGHRKTVENWMGGSSGSANAIFSRMVTSKLDSYIKEIKAEYEKEHPESIRQRNKNRSGGMSMSD